MMLRTTMFGTKRVKASMPLDRPQNACCNRATSVTCDRRPDRSSSSSRVWYAKSMSPRLRINLPKLRKGLVTKNAMISPMPMLSTIMPTLMPRLARRARFKCLSESLLIAVTLASTSCARTIACVANASNGRTATTSHDVSSSSETGEVPTCKQSMSAEHFSSTPRSWRTLGRKVKSWSSFVKADEFHFPNMAISAKEVCRTTFCGDSEALVSTYGIARCWWEAPTRRPSCSGNLFATLLTKNTLEISSLPSMPSPTQRWFSLLTTACHWSKHETLVYFNVTSAETTPSKHP
mmetsp:Transcript_85654/g.262074  ORF Transcript_85654/g.262074 Transcript_85654/m.262074 type:complete len:292 (-) Transcript_85654:808-1683(-)